MWLLKPFAIFVIGIPVTLLGLVMVPLGLLFKRTYPETRTPFTQYPGEWELVRLPSWLKPWDNLYDGFLGDKRGWWSNECEKAKRTCRDFLSMFLWGAIRNPANYWSRNITGLDVSQCIVKKLAGNCDLPDENPGQRQWVHLRAYHENGWTYDRFFMSWAITNDHALMIDIGWKIKLSHNGMSQDETVKNRIKGSVFTISPWKKLT